MNVYDFDKTIYRRDCTADFIGYCLRHQPALVRFAPRAAAAGVLRATGRIDLRETKQRLLSFFPYLEPGAQELAARFWDGHIADVHGWYARVRRPDDVVISASPEFLVAQACDRLGAGGCLGSPVDPSTGRFTGPNCRDDEKVRRFRAAYPGAQVDDFYSDSLSDTPMARLARRAFLVSGESLRPWPQEALRG